MQRLYVDFSRVMSDARTDRVEVGFAADPQLQGVQLVENEPVVVYDSTLEVEAILHQESRQGQIYWYAVVDWATRHERMP